MLVTLSGNETLVKDVHQLKASSPMLSNPSGNTIEKRLMHPIKADFPIHVRPSPSTTFSKYSQPEKAALSMLVTLSGIVTLIKSSHSKNVYDIIKKQGSGNENSRTKIKTHGILQGNEPRRKYHETGCV